MNAVLLNKAKAHLPIARIPASMRLVGLISSVRRSKRFAACTINSLRSTTCTIYSPYNPQRIRLAIHKLWTTTSTISPESPTGGWAMSANGPELVRGTARSKRSATFGANYASWQYEGCNTRVAIRGLAICKLVIHELDQLIWY